MRSGEEVKEEQEVGGACALQHFQRNLRKFDHICAARSGEFFMHACSSQRVNSVVKQISCGDSAFSPEVLKVNQLS